MNGGQGPISSFFGKHRMYQSEAQLSYVQQNEIAMRKANTNYRDKLQYDTSHGTIARRTSHDFNSV